MTQLSPLLKRKYPKAKYAPRTDCRYCNGTGEVKGKRGVAPCICLFVQHDLIEMTLKVFPQAVAQTLGIDMEAFRK